ncbi:transposase [Chloracidobacterium thermophilum]|uniref:transposase n=1 Tax=Chloracidobacterium thermophilum TaxID=458033 RepID=UPI000738C935|nr:transposase [Chloracidobacterium thermophilum]
MKYDPARHHRRSIRLQGYDYSQAGAYFITICTQDRACLFGEIVNGNMRLNDAGRMVEKWRCEINRKFPWVETDEHIIMPNHFHGIIVINAPTPVGADLRVRPCEPNHPGAHDAHSGAHDAHSGAHDAHSGAHIGAPLPAIIQWFKTMTTNEYTRGVKRSGWPPFAGKLWQRNYYEHIIRDEAAFHRIREYIAKNPWQWEWDRENVRATGRSPEPEDEPWRI